MPAPDVLGLRYLAMRSIFFASNLNSTSPSVSWISLIVPSFSRFEYYPYVDGTQEEVMPFVCIETVCRGANRTTKSIDLYIWIFVHRDCMQMNKQHIKTYMGNRADVLTDIIERLLWDSNDLGIGNPSLSDIGYIIPQSKYFGRQIKYNISDFKTKEVG